MTAVTRDSSTRTSREPEGSKHPFITSVARLRLAHQSERHEHRVGSLTLDEPDTELSALTTLPDGAEVAVDVTLRSYEGGIGVTGTVSAPWEGLCRRCAQSIGGNLEIRVKERYSDEGGTLADEDAYPIVDDLIDLAVLARDAIALELPAAPLCRPDCAGLCPQCGADRNEEACTCLAPVDARWSKLDVLRSDH